MKISLDPQFVRCCEKLTAEENSAIFGAILKLRPNIATPGKHAGIGLRKLHPTNLWEIRVGLHLRAVFRMVKDQVDFQMVGTHDDVQRYLRTI